jgi:hypothetical protein
VIGVGHRHVLDAGVVDALRAATHGGWALGEARFKRQIAEAPGRHA